MSPGERRIAVGLLALEDSLLSSLAGPMDMLRVAQRVAEELCTLGFDRGGFIGM